MTRLLVAIILTVTVGYARESRGQNPTAMAVGDVQQPPTTDCSEKPLASVGVPPLHAMVLPVHKYVLQGEICTLQVWVDGAEDSLGCIECWVSFDTSLVDLVLAEEGELFTSAAFPRLFFWEDIAPDTQSVEGCLLEYKSFTLTPGEIARYVFQAKKNGACPVRITRLNLFDIDRFQYQPIIDPNAWILIGTSTGVEPPPADGGVFRAFPNPFNPSTTLVLRVADASPTSKDTHTTISVYSPCGKKVRDLFAGKLSGGEFQIAWDGRDGRGRSVASGVYFAVARTRTTTYKTKLVLVQ
jgi:hypothetical protein